jgi:hypothetical protein
MSNITEVLEGNGTLYITLENGEICKPKESASNYSKQPSHEST